VPAPAIPPPLDVLELELEPPQAARPTANSAANSEIILFSRRSVMYSLLLCVLDRDNVFAPE
jgi:hypothetical protein